MKHTWIAVIALAGLLVVPAIARAHDGHDKTVMGTVSSVDGTNLMVKTADGKSIMVMMNKETKVTQGTTKLQASAVKVGDRVVAAGPEDKNMITAETVKVGAAAPAAAAKKPVS